MSQAPNSASATGHSNLRMFGKLLAVAAVMFGFGFAMIPIYKAICEVTGVGLLTPRDRDAGQFAKNTQVDASRTVTVEFDANSRGTWLFRPERRSVSVHPGELVTVNYELVNTQPRATNGQAIPSYAPQQAAAHFRKLECFCFKQQALGAGETRRFPVVFVIDPRLPKDVNTITLSYTFFEVGGIPGDLGRDESGGAAAPRTSALREAGAAQGG